MTPVLRLIENEGEKVLKYLYTEEVTSMTEESILKFFDKFKQRQLRPYFLSEDIPKENNLPMKTIVGKNFKDFIDNSIDKDVLIYFWMPNCAKCQ